MLGSVGTGLAVRAWLVEGFNDSSLFVADSTIQAGPSIVLV